MTASSAVLIQHAVGPAAEMLDVTRDRHSEYCRRHGFEFRRTTEPLLRNGRNAKWEKVAALCRQFDTIEDGALVVWLDADAVIAGVNVDLRDVVPLLGTVDMGMVPWKGGMLNTGAIYMTLSPRVRRLFCDAEATGYTPNQKGLQDQATMDKLLRREEYRGLATRLPTEWNDYPFARYPATRPAIVKAWHGVQRAEALAGMREFCGSADLRFSPLLRHSSARDVDPV